MYVCMYVKNFWISAEMANLVNCLCYDLYCIVSFSMLYTAFVLVSGDCSIDICILFLFLCYCLVLFWFVLCLCFFCLFVFSDKFHVQLFVQQNLWTYEMIWYVCMYVSSDLLCWWIVSFPLVTKPTLFSANFPPLSPGPVTPLQYQARHWCNTLDQASECAHFNSQSVPWLSWLRSLWLPLFCPC